MNNGNIYYVHELECSVIFSTLSKLIYRFYVIPIRIPANLFFKEIDKLFHNVYEYAKDLREKFILKKTKLKNLHYLIFRLTVKQPRKWNKIERSKIDPNMCDNFVSGKDFFTRSEITLKIK